MARSVRRRPSFVYALGEKTLGQRALNALVNRHEQAFAQRDRAEQIRLRRAIRVALADFERSGGDGHGHPEWICPVMRANVHACFGRLEEALQEERRGEQIARRLLAESEPEATTLSHDLRHLLARSKSNLSDHLRRLGQPAEAIVQAHEGHDLWPENEGILVNLALALAHNGQPQLCGEIVRELTRTADLDNPKDILRAHALFEGELANHRFIPEVRVLLDRVRGVPGGETDV